LPSATEGQGRGSSIRFTARSKLFLAVFAAGNFGGQVEQVNNPQKEFQIQKNRTLAVFY
jgi:hypothetical protein